MDDFEKELKIGFLAEAKQSTSDVEQCFLSLENNPDDAENLNKIFRLAHNLKGSSKAVGFNEMGEFTHEFESFILRIKNKELPANAKAVNLLLRANDHVLVMLEGLTGDLNASFDSTTLIEEMKSFSVDEVEEPIQEDDSKLEVKLDLESLPTNAPVVSAPESFDLQKSVITNDDIVKVQPIAEESKKNNQNRSVIQVQDDSLRVSLQKIEHLINSVGEMVILQSGLREQSTLLNSTSLKRIVQHMGKVSKEIQETSMGLRMVPIRPVFQKMQRIVRDTSMSLNKDVSIELLGENTDIDKTILEKISDPLVHLVRNSVDHGIESAELRRSRGKVEKGHVKLNAYHQSGKLIIEVSDDGGGLDPEKLKMKAIEKGIVSPDDKLTDVEAWNLIFAPGFSTKEKVTDVSGRGVGMDVVKTNIHELGGEVQIDSKLGAGSTFKIILPLTLAIVDAMILTYANERFVIPINQVYETVKLDSQNFKESSMGDVLLLREENLPLLRLGSFFGLSNTKSVNDMIAIVVRVGTRPFAFLVDDIIGQSQVVVKQLGQELQGLVGISGSTILSDGKPALILEAQDLLKRPRTHHVASSSPKESTSKRIAV